MYMSNFDKVEEFMMGFRQEVKTSPEFPDSNVVDLRIRLIAEELQELCESVENEDIIEVADALADLLYVVYGAGHAFGIDLDECFEEVHESNMSKLDDDGNPIYRDDGKVLKSDNFFEPDLKRVLKRPEWKENKFHIE
jgi:predicted HAD superfamily Cof-like phosphohydrolase